MGKKIFITGLPGSGKSSLVMEIIRELGVKVGGIVTPEIKDHDRMGFKIVDIASGRTGILSRVDFSGPRIGKYGVNVKDLEDIGVKAIERSINDPEIKLLVIDEIGTMEMVSEKFCSVVNRALNSEKDCLMVLHRNLVNKYKNMGILFFLDRKNRAHIKRKIIELLERCGGRDFHFS